MQKKITIIYLKDTNNNEQTPLGQEAETQQLAITDNNIVENIEEPSQKQVVDNEVDNNNYNNNDNTNDNTDINENVRVQKLVKCPKCNKQLTERGLKYYHKQCPPSDKYQKWRQRKVPLPEKLLKPKQEETQDPPQTPPPHPPTPPPSPPPSPPKLTRQTSLIDNYVKPNLNNPKLRIMQRKQQRHEQINRLFENAF